MNFESFNFKSKVISIKDLDKLLIDDEQIKGIGAFGTIQLNQFFSSIKQNSISPIPTADSDSDLFPTRLFIHLNPSLYLTLFKKPEDSIYPTDLSTVDLTRYVINHNQSYYGRRVGIISGLTDFDPNIQITPGLIEAFCDILHISRIIDQINSKGVSSREGIHEIVENYFQSDTSDFKSILLEYLSASDLISALSFMKDRKGIQIVFNYDQNLIDAIRRDENLVVNDFEYSIGLTIPLSLDSVKYIVPLGDYEERALGVK